MVFDDGTLQNISGAKLFRNKVKILGNLTVDLLNGYNITEEFGNVLSNYGNTSVINASIVSIDNLV